MFSENHYKTYLIYSVILVAIILVLYLINRKETEIIEAKDDPLKAISDGFKKIPKGFSDTTKSMKSGLDKTGKDMKGGFDKMGKGIKTSFDKAGKEMKGGFNKVGKDMKGGLDKANNAMKGAFDKFGKMMGKEFKKIGDSITKEFKNIEKKAKAEAGKMTSTFTKLFKGIEKTFTGLFKKIQGFFNQIKSTFTGIFKSITDFFKCIAQAFKAIADYIMCGVQLLTNFPFCFIFYIFDCIYGIIQAIFLLVALILPPLKEPIDQLFKLVDDLKKTINDGAKELFGDTILWPKSIMDKCYRCKNSTPFPDFSKPGSCGKKDAGKEATRAIKYIEQSKVVRDLKKAEDFMDENGNLVANIAGVVIFAGVILFSSYIFMTARQPPTVDYSAAALNNMAPLVGNFGASLSTPMPTTPTPST